MAKTRNSGSFGPGRAPWNKGTVGVSRGGRPPGIPNPHTAEWNARISQGKTGVKMPWLAATFSDPSRNAKIAVAMTGPRNHRWKGGPGTNPTRHGLHSWSLAVRKRDNYTCQLCGATGVPLHADHIKPVRLFPELRRDLSNGRTLCATCHRKTPTYGGRAMYAKAV